MTSSDGGGEQPWNQQRLRSSNERLLLERLRAAPASRAQLAREQDPQELRRLSFNEGVPARIKAHLGAGRRKSAKLIVRKAFE